MTSLVVLGSTSTRLKIQTNLVRRDDLGILIQTNSTGSSMDDDDQASCCSTSACMCPFRWGCSPNCCGQTRGSGSRTGGGKRRNVVKRTRAVAADMLRGGKVRGRAGRVRAFPFTGARVGPGLGRRLDRGQRQYVTHEYDARPVLSPFQDTRAPDTSRGQAREQAPPHGFISVELVLRHFDQCCYKSSALYFFLLEMVLVS
jgi:hypothetical protein